MVGRWSEDGRKMIRRRPENERNMGARWSEPKVEGEIWAKYGWNMGEIWVKYERKIGRISSCEKV
jgi:hypothetical protein